MITIDPDKSKVLEFAIDITGNSTDPIARLVMPLEENMNLSILGEIHEKSIQVTVPKLRSIYESLKSGAAKLEIIVDGNVFTPWIDQIEFKEKLKVVVETVSEKEVEKPKDKVQVGASLINENISNSSKKNSKTKFDLSDDI